MHRTTLSFGDQDWKFIRRLAGERRMTISQLVVLALGQLIQKQKPSRGDWHFMGKSLPMGNPAGDFRTREGLYEFISR
jgi:hypothetical protein